MTREKGTVSWFAVPTPRTRELSPARSTRTSEETARYPDIGMMYREGGGYLTPDGQPLK